MSKFETSILHSPAGESFHQLPSTEKSARLAEANLSLTTYGAGIEYTATAFQEIQKLGFTPVKLNSILQGMAWLMRREQITLPTGKKQKQERGKVTGELLGRMDFESDSENNLRVNVQLEDGDERDILKEATVFDDLLAEDVKQLATDPMVLGKVLQKIKDLAKQSTSLAFEEVPLPWTNTSKWTPTPFKF